MPAWDHQPPRPNPKFIVATERESGQVVVLFTKDPVFNGNGGYRKRSINWYKRGYWGYWDNYSYRTEKYWNESPYHKDLQEILAKNEEEAINEYNKTRHN